MRLDAAETARKLPYSELVAEIARVARQSASGAVSAPERLVVPLGNNASLLCMPAVAPDIGITKIITVHQQNARAGLPGIQGEVIVFDVATGRRLMMLDGPTVTARRTAAVTLLAIERLAARPPRNALLIGTGVQAEAHLEALFEYFQIRSFCVAGRELMSAVRFCEKLRATHPDVETTPVAVSSLDPTGVGSDVVIALTTSRTPVIPPHLPACTLAIGVGAFRPEMAELPEELLRTRRIVVDHLKGAEHEAGDLLQAGVDWSQVTELSQLLEREVAPQSGSYAFKSVGHASWDLAAARVALRHL
ncbi:MAG TPA: delta(1)-pyrroline-2-carboxylate reductase family protein [Steroidobacter sp.]|uniref:delta(1)-pyrroline-2-carboxylate reductase family protein n=1 Tax=Steroidobacter sp. TaxID=1978227 RepID=UPI002ED9AB08